MKIKCSHSKVVDVAVLMPHPRNPNVHTTEQIKLLAKIMKHQGWRNPIVVSKRSGFIVAGHGRLQAAQLNKWSSAPVDEQDFENEADEYAHMVADNKIAELAEIDLSMVNTDVGDLGPDFDLDLLGIPGFEIEVADKIPGADEDEIPEYVEPKTKLGDIYQLGNHRLMCGDSTSIDAVEKLMNGEKPEMVYTDPPYGIDLQTEYQQGFGVGSLTKGRKGTDQKIPETKDYRRVIGDSAPFDPGILLGYFHDCPEVFLWGANYYWEHLSNSLSSSIVVWDKRVSEGLRKMHGNQLELCWSKTKHTQTVIPITWCGAYGSDEGKAGHKKVHPTQKPVKLAEYFFNEWGEQEDKVVDLFGGSGSTLIACEKTNRTCFMMELDPHYCDVVVARWEKYTGKKAELLNGQAL